MKAFHSTTPLTTYANCDGEHSTALHPFGLKVFTHRSRMAWDNTASTFSVRASAGVTRASASALGALSYNTNLQS